MRVFQILAVAGAVALLAGGCVSSKRAMRVSPLAKEVEVSFDQEAVNLWPFYFNAGGSGAILWPLADFDAQGFAVRPFYVQDGRERSVLFPLSAWNDRSGWALNGYWTERTFGMWPLFHHGPGGGYCLLGWRSPESWGVFPLARFGARGGGVCTALFCLLSAVTGGAMLAACAELSALVWPIRPAYAAGFFITLPLAVWLAAHGARGLAAVGGALCALTPVLLVRLLCLPEGEACFFPAGPPDRVLRARWTGRSMPR